MKNLFYISAILILSFSIGISYLTYKDEKKINESKNINIINDLSQATSVLNKLNKLPMPGGSNIYFTKDGKTTKNIKQADIIGGWLCGKEFSKLGIGITEPFHNKCYKYSVTKNQKYYQIGAIIQEKGVYKTYLTGNSEKNITKDYINDKIISNNDKENFPYNPYTKFIGAKIIGANISQGKLIVVDKNGKGKQLNGDSINGHEISAFDTIILKGKDNFAYIKFENQDILKLSGDSIVKIQESEIIDEKINNNIFWLLGNISYNIYDKNNNTTINSPNQNLGIRGDILEGVATIENDNYSIKTKIIEGENILQKNNLYKIKQIKNIDQVLEGNNGLNADILNTYIDTEKLIEIQN